MHTALGINFDGGFNSITTNVDMGPARTVIDWSYWLGLAAVVVAVAVIAVLMVVRRRRKR
jgi:cytochrome c-type biogenesis protein CcmH/NrfF